METGNAQKIVVSIIGVLILASIVFIVVNKATKENTIQEEVVGGVTIEYEDGTTGTADVVKVSLDKPKLLKKRNIPESLDEFSQEQLALLIDNLDDNPTDFTLWSEYGAYMKNIEDFARAEEAWIYASALRPDSSLPLENLANLYGYYLSDPVQAEEYILLAIEQEPSRIALYGKAYDLYKDVFNDAVKAKAILTKGYEVTKDSSIKAFLDNLD